MTDTSPARAPTESEPARRGIPWGRIGLVVAASTTLVWLAAIVMSFGGPARDADYVADRRFFEAAEPLCEAAATDLDALPVATETPEPADRLAVIEDSTERLEKLLADLRAAVPDGAANEPVRLWLSHWDIHVSDRRDFIDRVQRIGTDERFLESEVSGTQVSKSVNRFAEVNDIASCVIPNDV